MLESGYLDIWKSGLLEGRASSGKAACNKQVTIFIEIIVKTTVFCRKFIKFVVSILKKFVGMNKKVYNEEQSPFMANHEQFAPSAPPMYISPMQISHAECVTPEEIVYNASDTVPDQIVREQIVTNVIRSNADGGKLVYQEKLAVATSHAVGQSIQREINNRVVASNYDRVDDLTVRTVHVAEELGSFEKHHQDEADGKTAVQFGGNYAISEYRSMYDGPQEEGTGYKVSEYKSIYD